jgi:bis(5'-nucleosyl)-tetraphosphatase (symmetrical)
MSNTWAVVVAAAYQNMQLKDMATYAIGDIQGCYRTLKRLLKRIAFHPQNDRILLVGDLVNRGPNSLDVLRWASGLGERVISVLGNHDIHLIAMAKGVSEIRRTKILDQVLRARDSDKLIKWLRKRPIMYREHQFILVHAGILPAWTISEAEHEARKLEELIQGNTCATFLKFCYRSQSHIWHSELSGLEKSAVALNAFTRMRMCKSPNEMEFAFAGKPSDAPEGLTPWFQVKGRHEHGRVIIFGHWAALGLRVLPHTIALDSGCVWGQYLTAYRIDDGAIFIEPSLDK